MKKRQPTKGGLHDKDIGPANHQAIIRKKITINIPNHKTTIAVSATKSGWLALKTDINLGAPLLRESIIHALDEIFLIPKRPSRKAFKVHVAATFAYFYSCLQRGAKSWPLHFCNFLKLTEGHCGSLTGITTGRDKERHSFAIKLTVFAIYGIRPDGTHSNYRGIGRFLIFPGHDLNYEIFRQQFITNENYLVTGACAIARGLLQESEEASCPSVGLQGIDGDDRPTKEFISKIEALLPI